MTKKQPTTIAEINARAADRKVRRSRGLRRKSPDPWRAVRVVERGYDVLDCGHRLTHKPARVVGMHVTCGACGRAGRERAR